MTFSEPHSQYEENLRDAIQASVKESKINFTQMARYSSHYEQTYRQNINRRKKDCADWLLPCQPLP
ncbi:MAG: hypothetical protein ACOYJF_05005 [Prevotella sp.]|jgi:hypothetical protein